VEQKKEGRGLWEKPPSSSPLHKQNRGEGLVSGRLWPVRPAALPGMVAVDSEGNGERGGRGQLVPVLTLGWDGLWKEINGGRRTVVQCSIGGSGGSSGGREGGDGRCGVRRRAVLAIYRRGKAVSRPGSSTRSSCLPVNVSSGSSACGIRDGEKTRRDGGVVGQDPTGSNALESEPG
jgi:hypothetical protein